MQLNSKNASYSLKELNTIINRYSNVKKDFLSFKLHIYCGYLCTCMCLSAFLYFLSAYYTLQIDS